MIQIGNNPYAKSGDSSPMGTRPRLDTGRLGIDVIAYTSPTVLRKAIGAAGRGTPMRSRAYETWTGSKVTISRNDGTVPAGVDGESIEFPSPLEISIRPGALRIRVPKERPGTKSAWPRLDWRLVARLWSILLGGDTDPSASV